MDTQLRTTILNMPSTSIKILIIGEDLKSNNSLLEAFKKYFMQYVKMNSGHSLYYRFDFFYETDVLMFHRVSLKFDTLSGTQDITAKEIEQHDFFIRCFDARLQSDYEDLNSLVEIQKMIDE